MSPQRRFLLRATGSGAFALWLFWPLLRPHLAPRAGATLVVAFDGYDRLETALARTRAPLLLLSCPVMGRLTPLQWRRAGDRPVFIDRSGPDSARQLTALATWLERPPPGLPAFGRVLLVSDSNQMPRIHPAARLALGGRGYRVDALLTDGDRPPARRFPHPGPWPIARDWGRLQLWRATGSTGAFLVPLSQRRKELACLGI